MGSASQKVVFGHLSSESGKCLSAALGSAPMVDCSGLVGQGWYWDPATKKIHSIDRFDQIEFCLLRNDSNQVYSSKCSIVNSVVGVEWDYDEAAGLFKDPANPNRCLLDAGGVRMGKCTNAGAKWKLTWRNP